MKLKKIIAGVMAAALSLSVTAYGVLSVEVKAEDYSDEMLYGDYLTYQQVDEDEDGTYDYIEITDCDESAITVEISTEIDGLPVTSIGRGAFFDCSSLTSITIPNGVASIGKSAFYGCNGLTEITLPASINKMEVDSFGRCVNLKKLIVSDGVENLYSNQVLVGAIYFHQVGAVDVLGFQGAGFEYIESLYIPKTLKYIDINFFSNSENLTDVYFDGTKSEYNVWVAPKYYLPYSEYLNDEDHLIGNCYYENAVFHYADVEEPVITTTVTTTPLETTTTTVTTVTTSKTTTATAKPTETVTTTITTGIALPTATTTSAVTTTSSATATATQTTTQTATQTTAPTETTTASTTETEPTTPTEVSGDANGDNITNVRDCAFIASALAKGMADTLPKSADFNGDGKINVRDAVAIAKFLAEK